MFMRMLLCLGAAFYLLNGVLMLSGPQAWYIGVPGVSATGAYNHHFIVGMIRADGVDSDRLRALVRRDFERAHPVSALGFAYVEAALRRNRTGRHRPCIHRVAHLPRAEDDDGARAVCEALDVDGQSERVAPA